MTRVQLLHEAAALTGGERIGDWMQTYSGRQFWPLDPRPEDVCLIDIAHSLSMQCRYAGHCLRFYSVAEHCVHLCDMAPDGHRQSALMHDAAEAYLVDLPRPVKLSMPIYKQHEARLASVIAEAFGIAALETPSVMAMDRRILMDECQQSMAAPPVKWSTDGEPLGVTLQFWSPSQAREEFMARAKLLGIGG